MRNISDRIDNLEHQNYLLKRKLKVTRSMTIISIFCMIAIPVSMYTSGLAQAKKSKDESIQSTNINNNRSGINGVNLAIGVLEEQVRKLQLASKDANAAFVLTMNAKNFLDAQQQIKSLLGNPKMSKSALNSYKNKYKKRKSNIAKALPKLKSDNARLRRLVSPVNKPRVIR